MPFFHFGPPHMHGFAILASGLLAGAALTFAYARTRLALARQNPAALGDSGPARAFFAAPFGLMSRFASRSGKATSVPGSQSNESTAFQDYKAETMRRLEAESAEFSAYLARLKHAADRVEFEQFMAERRARRETPPAN
ncbi:MAG: DUF2852 domain-containing protein [Hyphomicrobium sp.]|jgi:hypothetical protein|nr:DUF2852 domain-containing protein [Hyphomicrobium sp.]